MRNLIHSITLIITIFLVSATATMGQSEIKDGYVEKEDRNGITMGFYLNGMKHGSWIS